MFMLALLSYDPGDLPGWAPLVMSDQANTVTRNFIGQTGAIVAGYSLFLMGMATYLVPISLMWFGVCKLANKNRITRSNWLGVVILVVAGASLLQVNGLYRHGYLITPALLQEVIDTLHSAASVTERKLASRYPELYREAA